MTRVPVTFASRGEELVGIVTLPAGVRDRADVGVVFALSGSRGRLGNSFHYPFFSRAFAAAGVPTFRFDPAGLGDSSGSVAAGELRGLYREIQSGLFVEDTLAAVEAFRRRVEVRRLLLLGVCGGAVTALLAAPRVPGLDGVILLSLPVLLDDPPGVLEPAPLPRAYARAVLARSYARKLLSPSAWARFVAGRSDRRGILRFAMASLRPSRRRAADPGAPHPNPRFNPRVVSALDAVVERAAVLVLFGEGDAYRQYWEEDVRRVYWSSRPRYAQRIEEHFLPGCNHMFTLREWQEDAMRRALAWVRAREGGGPARAAAPAGGAR